MSRWIKKQAARCCRALLVTCAHLHYTADEPVGKIVLARELIQHFHSRGADFGQLDRLAQDTLDGGACGLLA